MLRISSTNLASGNFLCTFCNRWRRDGRKFRVMSFGPDFESRYITSCQNTIKWSMTRFPYLSTIKRNSSYANRTGEKCGKRRSRESVSQRKSAFGRQDGRNKAVSLLNCYVSLDQNGSQRGDRKQIHSGKTKTMASYVDRRTPPRRSFDRQDRDAGEENLAGRTQRIIRQADAEKLKTLERIGKTVKVKTNYKILNSEDGDKPPTDLNVVRMKVRQLGKTKTVWDNYTTEKADNAFMQFQELLEVPATPKLQQFLHEQEVRRKNPPKTIRKRSVNVFKVSDPYVRQRLLKNKVNVEIYNQMHLLNEKEPQCEFAEVQCGKKKLYIAFLDDNLPQPVTHSAYPTDENSQDPPSHPKKPEPLSNKLMHMSPSQIAKVTPEKIVKIMRKSSTKKGKIVKMIHDTPKGGQDRPRSTPREKTTKFRFPHRDKDMKMIVNLKKDYSEESSSPPLIQLQQKRRDSPVAETLKFQIRKIEKYWFPTESGKIKIQYLTGVLSGIKNMLKEELPKILKASAAAIPQEAKIMQCVDQDHGDGDGIHEAVKIFNLQQDDREDIGMEQEVERVNCFKLLRTAATKPLSQPLDDKKNSDIALESSESNNLMLCDSVVHSMDRPKIKPVREVRGISTKKLVTEVGNQTDTRVSPVMEKPVPLTQKEPLVFLKRPVEAKKELPSGESAKSQKPPIGTTPKDSSSSVMEVLRSRRMLGRQKIPKPVWKEIEKISKEREAELTQVIPPQPTDQYFLQVTQKKVKSNPHWQFKQAAAAAAAAAQQQSQALQNEAQNAQVQEAYSQQVRSGESAENAHTQSQNAFQQRGQWLPQQSPRNAESPNVEDQKYQSLPMQKNSGQQLNNWLTSNSGMQPAAREAAQQSATRQTQGEKQNKTNQENKEGTGEDSQSRPREFYYPKVTGRKMKNQKLPTPAEGTEAAKLTSIFQGREPKVIPISVQVPPIYVDKDVQMYEDLKGSHSKSAAEPTSQKAPTETVPVAEESKSTTEKNWDVRENWNMQEKKVPNLRKMVRASSVNADVVHSFIIEADTLGECYSTSNKLPEFIPRTAMEYNFKYEQEPELKTFENAVAEKFMKIDDLDIIELQKTENHMQNLYESRQTPPEETAPSSNVTVGVDAETNTFVNSFSRGNSDLSAPLTQSQTSGTGYNRQVQVNPGSIKETIYPTRALSDSKIHEAPAPPTATAAGASSESTSNKEVHYKENSPACFLSFKLEDDIDTITTTRTVQPSEVAAIMNEEVVDPASRPKSPKSMLPTPSKPTKTPPTTVQSPANVKTVGTNTAVKTEPANEQTKEVVKGKEADESAPRCAKVDAEEETKDELLLKLKEELSFRLQDTWKVKDFNELTETIKPVVEQQLANVKPNNHIFLEKSILQQPPEMSSPVNNGKLEVSEVKDLKNQLEGRLPAKDKITHIVKAVAIVPNQKTRQTQETDDHKSRLATLVTETKLPMDKSKKKDDVHHKHEKKTIEPVMMGESKATDDATAKLLGISSAPEAANPKEEGSKTSDAVMDDEKRAADHLPRKDHPYLPNTPNPHFIPSRPKDKDHPYLPNWDTPPRPPSQPHHTTDPYYYQPQQPQQPQYTHNQPQQPQHPQYTHNQPQQPQHPQYTPPYQPQQPQPRYHPHPPQTNPQYQQPQPTYQPHYPQHPYHPPQPQTRPNIPQQPQTPAQPAQPTQPTRPGKSNQQTQPPPKTSQPKSFLDQFNSNTSLNIPSEIDSPDMPKFQVQKTINMYGNPLDRKMTSMNISAIFPGKLGDQESFEGHKMDDKKEWRKFVQPFVPEPKYRKWGKYANEHRKFKSVKRTAKDKDKPRPTSEIKLKELPPPKPDIKKRSDPKTLESAMKATDNTTDQSKKSDTTEKANELGNTMSKQEPGKPDAKKDAAAKGEADKKEDGSKTDLRMLDRKKEEDRQKEAGLKAKLGIKFKKPEAKKEDEQRELERQKVEDEKRISEWRMALERRRNAGEFFGYGSLEEEPPPRPRPPPPKVDTQKVQKMTNTPKPAGKTEEEKKKGDVGKRKSDLTDWEKDIIEKTSSIFRFMGEDKTRKAAEADKSKEKAKEKFSKPDESSKLDSKGDSKTGVAPKIISDKGDNTPGGGSNPADKTPKMSFEEDTDILQSRLGHYRINNDPQMDEDYNQPDPVRHGGSETNLDSYNSGHFNFGYQGDSFNLYLNRDEAEEMLQLFEKSRQRTGENSMKTGYYTGGEVIEFLPKPNEGVMASSKDKKFDGPEAEDIMDRRPSPKSGDDGKPEDKMEPKSRTVSMVPDVIQVTHIVKTYGDPSRDSKNEEKEDETMESFQKFGMLTTMSSEQDNEKKVHEYIYNSVKGSRTASDNVVDEHGRGANSGRGPKKFLDRIKNVSLKGVSDLRDSEYAPINEMYVNPSLEEMNLSPGPPREQRPDIIIKVFKKDRASDDKKNTDSAENNQRSSGKTVQFDGAHESRLQELRSCIEILKNALSSEQSEKKFLMDKKAPAGSEPAEPSDFFYNPYEQFLKMAIINGNNEMIQLKNRSASEEPEMNHSVRFLAELLNRTVSNAENEIGAAYAVHSERTVGQRLVLDHPEMESMENSNHVRNFLQLFRNAIEVTENEISQKPTKSGAGDTKKDVEKDLNSFLTVLKDTINKSDAPVGARMASKAPRPQNKRKVTRKQITEVEDEEEPRSPRTRSKKMKGSDAPLEAEAEMVTTNKMVKQEDKDENEEENLKIEEEEEEPMKADPKKSAEVEKIMKNFKVNLSDSGEMTTEDTKVTERKSDKQAPAEAAAEESAEAEATQNASEDDKVDKKKKPEKSSRVTRKSDEDDKGPRKSRDDVNVKRKGNRMKLEELQEKVKRREMETKKPWMSAEEESSDRPASEPYMVNNMLVSDEATSVQFGPPDKPKTPENREPVPEVEVEPVVISIKEFTIREEPLDVEMVSLDQRHRMNPEEQPRLPDMVGVGTQTKTGLEDSEETLQNPYPVKEEEDTPTKHNLRGKTDKTAAKKPPPKPNQNKTSMLKKTIGHFLQKRDLQTFTSVALSTTDITTLRKESLIPNRPVMWKLLTSKSNDERSSGSSVLGESLRNRIASFPYRKTDVTRSEKDMSIKEKADLKIVRIWQPKGAESSIAKKAREIPCAKPIDPEMKPAAPKPKSQ
ncbi:UNVERIFIED_CONTAM: hypothetical protein PYX00_003384 [Menopon gallinae]|uniref:Uncharacterized protein n=1 Tax=Menopon gallinae TaxID=328185 RepID=A0AAW2I1R8_9NEOP